MGDQFLADAGQGATSRPPTISASWSTTAQGARQEAGAELPGPFLDFYDPWATAEVSGTPTSSSPNRTCCAGWAWRSTERQRPTRELAEKGMAVPNRN
jgi:hypothetical protein